MAYTRRSSREEFELSHDIAPGETGTDEPSIARELEAIPYEPLLPIEKKLIIWCLVMGIVLLGLLLWASATFFPVLGAMIRQPADRSSPERAPFRRTKTILTRRASEGRYKSRGLFEPHRARPNVGSGPRKAENSSVG